MLKLKFVLCAAALLMLSPAHAQEPVDAAKAKAEGKVSWYTSTPIEHSQRIVALFRQQTGIEVELFRSGGPAILSRFQQEMNARRVAVDVLTHSEPAAANALAKKGYFVPFKPKNFDKIADAAKAPDGSFVAQRLNMETHYLRSDRIAAADEPRTWDDLTNAKYKGKLVMTDPSFTSLQVSVVAMISKERGWAYYEKLRANDIIVVPGNQQVSDMLKRGERLIAVGALDSYAADLRTSVVKGSPHPNAAKLLAGFLVSDEVQMMLPADGGYSARLDIPAPQGASDLKTLKILNVHDDYIEKETQRIKRRFAEIFS